MSKGHTAKTSTQDTYIHVVHVHVHIVHMYGCREKTDILYILALVKNIRHILHTG